MTGPEFPRSEEPSSHETGEPIPPSFETRAVFEALVDVLPFTFRELRHTTGFNYAVPGIFSIEATVDETYDLSGFDGRILLSLQQGSKRYLSSETDGSEALVAARGTIDTIATALPPWEGDWVRDVWINGTLDDTEWQALVAPLLVESSPFPVAECTTETLKTSNGRITGFRDRWNDAYMQGVSFSRPKLQLYVVDNCSNRIYDYVRLADLSEQLIRTDIGLPVPGRAQLLQPEILPITDESLSEFTEAIQETLVANSNY